MSGEEFVQTEREELANSLTHGVGIALSAAGLGILVVLASLFGSVRHVVSCSIYGASLLFLFTASTLYHSFSAPRFKAFFRLIDHVAILVLIAGTYTPFALVVLHGGWGWTMLGLAWGLALAGIVFKIFSNQRYKEAFTAFYLLMGWMGIAFAKPILAAVPAGATLLLLAGGLFYTGGVVFFLWRSLPYSHTIWHVFVLLGSICHYFAVLFCVVPIG
jgi:hemolysin III